MGPGSPAAGAGGLARWAVGVGAGARQVGAGLCTVGCPNGLCVLSLCDVHRAKLRLRLKHETSVNFHFEGAWGGCSNRQGTDGDVCAFLMWPVEESGDMASRAHTECGMGLGRAQPAT